MLTGGMLIGMEQRQNRWFKLVVIGEFVFQEGGFSQRAMHGTHAVGVCVIVVEQDQRRLHRDYAR